jgi:hypothetical protein
MRFLSHSRFTILLTVMVLLNLTRLATVTQHPNPLLLNFVGAMILITATMSLCVERRSRTLALLLGIPAIGLTLSRNLFPGSEAHLVLMSGHVTSMLFLAFVVAMILQSLMTQSVVTRDSIASAFCGYLLIGVIFAEVYCLLELNVPNSFQVGSTFPDWTDDPLQRWLTLEYFSLTTLTTLGFGDVIPIKPAARGLAVFEATCGQFYLTVLVAGLVNLRASRDPYA